MYINFKEWIKKVYIAQIYILFTKDGRKIETYNYISEQIYGFKLKLLNAQSYI